MYLIKNLLDGGWGRLGHTWIRLKEGGCGDFTVYSIEGFHVTS